MTAWLFLAGAILCEVGGSLTLKAALDHRLLYVVVAIGYVSSFILLTYTLKAGLGLGVTYGVWAGLGVALTAVGSTIFFDEPLNAVMGIGMGLIIGGVVLVEVGASH
jgi:small multidrug resistance pump